MSLIIDSLSIYRGKKAIIKDISFTLKAGQMLALLGANGAGKSSILSAISDINNDMHISGDIVINGQSINQFSWHDLAFIRSVLPQKNLLNFDLDIIDIISMGLYPFPQKRQIKLTPLIDQAIKIADIGHLLSRRFLSLSGGEQQRVQFARTLLQVLAAAECSHETCYFFLDEPTSSLDLLHQKKMLESLHTLCREKNIAVIIVLHDVNLAARWCHLLALIHRGYLYAFGDPKSILTPQNLLTVYGIQAKIIDNPIINNKINVVWE